MYRHVIAFFYLIWLLPLSASAQTPEAIQWTLVQDKDRIKVYKGTIPNSPLVAFRGIRTMPVSLGKVAHVLLTKDTELRKKWVESLIDTANLEQPSQTTAVIYNAFKAPWPIAKRDFVSRAELTFDKPQKTIRLFIKATQHPKAPPTVGIRAEILHSLYTLKALGPSETEVTIEALVDFKGSLPYWLVNLVQSKWPEKTLGNMQTVAEDPKITELEWVNLDQESRSP
jgi:hypothetical protein